MGTKSLRGGYKILIQRNNGVLWCVELVVATTGNLIHFHVDHSLSIANIVFVHPQCDENGELQAFSAGLLIVGNLLVLDLTQNAQQILFMIQEL